MQFRILGRLEVVQGGHALAIGGLRQRAVLARLLVDAGRVVPVDTLIDDVWEGDPPRTAVKTLHKYVSELRCVLHRPVAPGAVPVVLRTLGHGYVVDVAGGDGLDAHQFVAAVAAARHAARQGDGERAADTFRDALGLWRGEALADFRAAAFALPYRTGLEELRVAALEECLHLEVGLGRHAETAPELMRLVTVYPLRERLWGLLMRALATSGRTAEALRAFQRCRRILGEELGLVPGAELVALEARIVRGDLLAPTYGRTDVRTSVLTPTHRFRQVRTRAAPRRPRARTRWNPVG